MTQASAFAAASPVFQWMDETSKRGGKESPLILWGFSFGGEIVSYLIGKFSEKVPNLNPPLT
jgi:hypothetical protein